DQIEVLAANLLEPFGAVVRDVGLVTFRLEVLADAVGEMRLVVDDEDARRARGGVRERARRLGHPARASCAASARLPERTDEAGHSIVMRAPRSEPALDARTFAPESSTSRFTI